MKHDLRQLWPPGLPDRARCTCGKTIFPDFPDDVTENKRNDILIDTHRAHRAREQEGGK